jgi:hypothetical protein
MRGDVMKVVAGVNAGTAACGALCWAYGFARRNDASLEVVTAYTPVPATAALSGYAVVEPALVEHSARATQERVGARHASTRRFAKRS